MTLDVVRGIAILLVILFHFQMATGLSAIDTALQPFARAGWAGVDLFFVLSGFLVGRVILDEASQPGGFHYRRFIWRRALRLWPALYVYLAALWLAGDGADWRMIWPVLLHIQNYTEWAPSHLWSLAVEEHFYLAGALLLPVLLRGGSRRVVAALSAIIAACLMLRIAALAVNVPMLTIQWQTQYRIDALALGVALAYCALRRPEWLERAGRYRKALFVASASGFAMLAIGDDGTFRHGIGFTIAAFASAAFLVAMLDARVPAALLLPARAIAWLGTISYSLYLWHASLGRVAEALAPAIGLSHPLLVLAFKLALAIGVSALLYAMVERPATRLRDANMFRGTRPHVPGGHPQTLAVRHQRPCSAPDCAAPE